MQSDPQEQLSSLPQDQEPEPAPSADGEASAGPAGEAYVPDMSATGDPGLQTSESVDGDLSAGPVADAPAMPPPPLMPTASVGVSHAWGRPHGTSGQGTSHVGGSEAIAPAPVQPPDISAVGSVPDTPDSVADSRRAPEFGAYQASEGTAAPYAVPAAGGDWLASVCPYLVSEDGTYRSAEPDPAHRCAAADPPGTLPLAFQERFCLTDQHPRCEMYKYAQEAASGATVAPLASAGKGSTRLVSSRPAGLLAAGIGGIIIVVLALLLFMGACSGGTPAPGGDLGSTKPTATTAAETALPATPTPKPTPVPSAGPETSPASEPGEQGVGSIRYEVQADEKLIKIAQNFGTSRRAIIEANVGMADKKPYVETGDVIVVPVSPDMTLEQVEAMPGYLGPAG